MYRLSDIRRAIRARETNTGVRQLRLRRLHNKLMVGGKKRKRGSGSSSPILVISDIHGQFDKMINALNWFAKKFPNHLCTVVLIGDFVDNGDQIPEVLDWLKEADNNQWIHPKYPRFQLRPILGNHDMACLLSVESEVFRTKYNKKQWWRRWRYFWNDEGTPGAYGTRTQKTFENKFPHADLLKKLPWYHREDGYVFVHAGLKPRVHFSEQLEYLDQKDLSVREKEYQTYRYDTYKTRYGIPDQLTHKGWAETNDPTWGCIVVTGHNKYPNRENFKASHRLGLHSGSCEGHSLHCAILPRGATQMGAERLLKTGNGFKVFDYRSTKKRSSSSNTESSATQ